MTECCVDNEEDNTETSPPGSEQADNEEPYIPAPEVTPEVERPESPIDSKISTKFHVQFTC
jgi:hypothetical protein